MVRLPASALLIMTWTVPFDQGKITKLVFVKLLPLLSD